MALRPQGAAVHGAIPGRRQPEITARAAERTHGTGRSPVRRRSAARRAGCARGRAGRRPRRPGRAGARPEGRGRWVQRQVHGERHTGRAAVPGVRRMDDRLADAGRADVVEAGDEGAASGDRGERRVQCRGAAHLLGVVQVSDCRTAAQRRGAAGGTPSGGSGPSGRAGRTGRRSRRSHRSRFPRGWWPGPRGADFPRSALTGLQSGWVSWMPPGAACAAGAAPRALTASRAAGTAPAAVVRRASRLSPTGAPHAYR